MVEWSSGRVVEWLSGRVVECLNACKAKREKRVSGGLLLLPCPERQGSGGIQPADGWAWFQGRHAFGLGHKGCSPLGGIRKGGSPYGAVQPPGGSGVQGPDSEAPWRGTSLAMYNLAIPAFAFFCCAGGCAAKPHGHGVFMGVPGSFCRNAQNAETRTQSQSPDVTHERI